MMVTTDHAGNLARLANLAAGEIKADSADRFRILAESLMGRFFEVPSNGRRSWSAPEITSRRCVSIA